ncbi:MULTISPECIES: tRNA (adenosine(37)-N6)-threonylcarbamoyltransferase complex dimerization subunit type 1 TsaB [Thioalkalivibrio]|uniref:tRNA threonylcarbamoyladenosine biosynthesis protein TsaB n=1 Tax=Thioalkalivibrio versutus TaxID=106634 RepID=A0A0G3G0Z1_9GAMM|nr:MULTISPECIES: tRNA (adenosine(37)-N6)-threonylcarbamoyltransferase complex dimerization subunit type 1 TsaB [Thioalkalivibrio]AKJ94883.1 peptidase M22 [Thioalkalivibrio versutus]OOC50734.1 tRNA (adenosine(37)-N6)-threonylcarbamoyltransferase complex dimerization subunit type 1 TsaB [Thioalkalivibrio versutus]
MRLIALETASEQCSAALYLDGEIHCVRERAARRHGELILGQIEQLLREADVPRSSLDGVAVGRGPGAFTGVRLGLGVAQGIAFALDRPVVPVSTLQALAQQALRDDRRPAAVLAALDARMGEVYWSLCPVQGERVGLGPEQVAAPESLVVAWPVGERYGLGSAFATFPDLAAAQGLASEAVDADALPDAQEVALLAVDAWERGEAVAPEDAQPVYVRDDVARPASPR